jgi:hypothetical protein
LQVDQTLVVSGPGVGVVMAKSGSGVRQKIRDAGDKIGMAFGCKGLAALLCSEAARRAMEKIAEVANADNDGGATEIQQGVVIVDKIAKQMARRGWTKDLIETTRNSAYTTREAVNKSNNNPATAYYNKDGSYIVVDNITKQVIQISDRLRQWFADSTIKDPYVPGK